MDDESKKCHLLQNLAKIAELQENLLKLYEIAAHWRRHIPHNLPPADPDQAATTLRLDLLGH